MTTTELIEELSKKPKDEIKYALMALMVDGKLDFVDLNASYVNYLEFKKDDNENMLIESDTCVMGNGSPVMLLDQEYEIIQS